MLEETTAAVGKVIQRKHAVGTHAGEPVVMSLGDHLEELRSRVILGLLGVVPIFVVALVFGKTMLSFVIEPMRRALIAGGQPPNLLATSVFETFGTYVKLSLLATVVAGFPWLLWQAWKFLSPGLYKHEQRFAKLLLPLSLTLSVVGGVFMYYVALPIVLGFFVAFTTSVSPAPENVAPLPPGVSVAKIPILEADPPAPAVGDEWIYLPMRERRTCVAVRDGKPEVLSTPMQATTGIVQQPRVAEYVDQLISLALAFALAFQAPVVVLLLGWVGIVSVELLSQYRRHAAMGIAVVSAVLTPPDPVSIFVLAVPLYVLFELGLVLLRIFPASVGEREGAGAEADEP